MSFRMLIVDNEESILFALHEYFSACNYSVHGALTFDEAKILVDVIDYDVLITDLRLTGQGIEGLELIGQMRARSTAPIILLTAYGNDEIEQAAREYGADAVIHKPAPLPHIAQIVIGLLNREAEGDAHAC